MIGQLTAAGMPIPPVKKLRKDAAIALKKWAIYEARKAKMKKPSPLQMAAKSIRINLKRASKKPSKDLQVLKKLCAVLDKHNA